MSYEFYKLAHVIAVLFLFTSLGVLVATAGSPSAPLRRAASIAHGVALALIFIAGFGLLAKLGYFGAIPAWAYLKMVVWAVLALAVVPLKRKPEWAPALWFVIPAVGGVAVWLAVAQPF